MTEYSAQNTVITGMVGVSATGRKLRHILRFREDKLQILIWLAVCMMILIISALAMSIAVIVKRPPQDFFFATAENQSILREVPLNEPYVDSSLVISWTARTVAEVWTLGHHDYNLRLAASRKNFTDRAWQQFRRQLSNPRQRVIEAIISEKALLSGLVTEAPIIRTEGVDKDGVYRWVVWVERSVTPIGGQTVNRMIKPTATVKLSVARVSNLSNPYGVAIDSWVEE